MVIQVRMEHWTSQEVSNWLQTEFKIDEQQAAAISRENIDWQALLLLTAQQLNSVPFNIRFGDALKIVHHVQKLQNASGKKPFQCYPQPKSMLYSLVGVCTNMVLESWCPCLY